MIEWVTEPVALGELSPGEQAQVDYKTASTLWWIVGGIVVFAVVWSARRGAVGAFRENPEQAWAIGDVVKILSHDSYLNGQVGTITEMHTRHGGTIRYTVTLQRGNREVYVSEGSLVKP